MAEDDKMWDGNGSGLLLTSGMPNGNFVIRLFKVDKVKKFFSWTKTESMHLNSTTATPSKMSCITSGGSPEVT